MEISELLIHFVYAFTTIFVIVNPVEATLVYVTLTSSLNSKERTHIYRRTTLVAFAIAILFSLAGTQSYASSASPWTACAWQEAYCSFWWP